MLSELRARGFDLLGRNHVEAILRHDFPDETRELVEALLRFELPAAEIVASGGGEAASTQRLRRELAAKGWRKHKFEIALSVDGIVKEAVTHEIDHVRRAVAGTLALEIEWNNKDPFFDRDLENFQRLHAQSVISLGIVVTRGASLQDGLVTMVEAFLERENVTDAAGLLPYKLKRRTDRQIEAVARLEAAGQPFLKAFAKAFVADKFGQATTHWRKLAHRVQRGVGNPCPLLLIGLPAGIVRTDGYSAASVEEL